MTTHRDDELVEQVRTSTLAALRPEPVRLDPAWSQAQLQRVFTGPAPARRGQRRHRAVVGAALVGVLAAGSGAAYATGTLPGFLDLGLRSMVGAEPTDRVDMTRYLDLRLPDGGRVTAWAGTVDGKPCSATVDNWDGSRRMAGMGMTCSSTTQGEPSHADLSFSPGADRERYFPVVSGMTSRRDARTAVVVVTTPTGERRYEVPVESRTGGFGVVLDEGERDDASMQEEWSAPSGVEVPAVPTDSPLRAIRVELRDVGGQVVERHRPLLPW